MTPCCVNVTDPAASPWRRRNIGSKGREAVSPFTAKDLPCAAPAGPGPRPGLAATFPPNK